MVTEEAYRLALRRMLKWVEKNMDPRSTRVFFTSMSPSHHRSYDDKKIYILYICSAIWMHNI